MMEYQLQFSENCIPFLENSRVVESPYSNKAFAIVGSTLYEFEFNKDAEPQIKKSENTEYPLEDAKLLHVEPIDAKYTAVIVKMVKGIRIYLQTSDKLLLAVEDDRFHDVYGWNKPDNKIYFGNFFHDTNHLGMMTTHVEKGVSFYAIFKDELLAEEFPIYTLEMEKQIFETYCPNSSLQMPANLTGKRKSSIVFRNHEGLCFFEFNEANSIEFVMKVPHCGISTQTNDEAIFFTDLTDQKYADIVLLNSNGMYVYQFDENYKLLHYNPSFSKEYGWTTDHMKTVKFADVNSDGYLEMVFTGPKGIEAIQYDKHEDCWNSIIDTSKIPPSMRHAQLMLVIPQIDELIDDCYFFTQHEGSGLHWTKVVPLPILSNQRLDSNANHLNTAVTPALIPPRNDNLNMLQPTLLLRDMDIWSDISNNGINPTTGKPRFSIPLVNLPEPSSLKLILNYDATSSSNDILGIGWSLPMNLIAMDDSSSVFEEDNVFIIVFQNSTNALVYEPSESTSTVLTYKMISSNDQMKFRARFHCQLDQWIVDLGNGFKQIYGRTQSNSNQKGAVSRDIVWKNWHGRGFDSDNQLERTRMWYLAEVRNQCDVAVMEFYYDVDSVKVHSGMEYTRAVYLKKFRDYQQNEIELYYDEKPTNEYVTYDVQDQEGNYNWEPIRTRYLKRYTFTISSLSSKQQEVIFNYSTSDGYRFLAEILQPQDGCNSPVAKFEYLNFSKGKFALNLARLPNDVKIEFSYHAIGDENTSNELKRLDVSPDYVITTGDDYILVSYLNGKSPGQIVLRMFNLELTEELYTSDSRIKNSTKGRWPLLGAPGSVCNHEVIKGENYFGVILYYATTKFLCLFGRTKDPNSNADEWIKESVCHRFTDSATIQSGQNFCLVADPQSSVELFEWKSKNRTWYQKTIIAKAHQTVISVFNNKFVTYDNCQLSLGFKENNGTWQHKPLAIFSNALSNTEDTLKRFDLTEDYMKLIPNIFRNNMLKFNHNLIALNCLNLNGYQLQSTIKLYTIDKSKNISYQCDVVIQQDNLNTFVSKAEKDNDGTYFKFKYEIKSNGKIYIKVADFWGTLLKKLENDKSLERKAEVHELIEKEINAPATRFLLTLQNYIMSFHEKMIMCNDQKLTFGGDQWQRTSLTEKERALERENCSIPLADKFIIEKVNKNSNVQLLNAKTREILTNLTVNLTDVRVFYPVYLATQTKGAAVRIIEFDTSTNSIREISLPSSEKLSPYSNTFMLITDEGFSNDSSRTVIFRQQYGLKKYLPDHVVNEITLIFENGRKKRVTGFEYDLSAAEFRGNTVVYSKMSMIPGNKKNCYGWLEHSLSNDLSIAYDNHGDVVKRSCKQDQQSNDGDEMETETEEQTAFKKETTIFDESGMLEIAQCAPFRLKDEFVGYYGFEDYEQNTIGSSKHWIFNESNIIRNGFALTGRNYLHQKTEPIEGVFQPSSNQIKQFVASTWVRLSDQLTEFPKIGDVTPYLKAFIQTSSDTVIESLLSEVKLTFDNWFYLELYVDLGRVTSQIPDGESNTNDLRIVVRVGPTVNIPIDIDHIRFAPLISDFNVSVFDRATNLNTAVIQSTGVIRQTVYNVYGTVVAKTDELNQIEEIKVYTTSDKFMQMPRSIITIQPEFGYLEQFAPIAFVKRWKITEMCPWKIAPYHLEHDAATSDVLLLNTNDIAPESYGIQMFYSLSEQDAELIINDIIQLSRFSNHCMINVKNTNQYKSIPIPNSCEILLLKEQDRLIIWINGNLKLDLTTTSNTTKNPLELIMSGKVTIKDVIVFSKALVNVNYQNDLGEPTQDIFLETAESIIIKEKLYDELGRQRITTQRVRINPITNYEPILGYMENFVNNDNFNQANSIWKTGLLNGLVTEAIGHSYGFTEIQYDNNPLNEKIISSLPGKEFSSSGNFSKRFTTNTTNLFIANRYPKSLNTNVTYQVEVKPGKIEDITVLNDQDKKIANLVHVPGGKDLFSTYKRNKDGKIVQILPPLYFERTGSFHKLNSDLLNTTEEDYQLQRKLGVHIEYNKNGKPICKTTADAGPLEHIYDEDQKLCFTLYYSYTEPNVVETIIYFTYDPLGRVLSTGHLLDITIPKSQLLTLKLNSTNSQEYQSFDYANFERHPTLRGRLLRTITMNQQEPFAEVMVVNNRGDVVEKRIILPIVDDTESTKSTLDSNVNEIFIGKNYLNGRLHTILYPSEYLGEPLVLVYGYDKLGRINSIGTPNHPNKFLQIQRNAAGQVTEEIYEPNSEYAFKQLRNYNEPGFLTKLQNKFQTEDICYTAHSYGGASRGDGSISRIKFSANWHKTAPNKKTLGLNEDSFVEDSIGMSLCDSKLCFDTLKNAGYLDSNNQQIKAFYPDLEVDLPIICTSGVPGRHVANVLGHNGFPTIHGYRFDYGPYEELTKAKYFIGSDEPDPLQPDTFSKEISSISQGSSIQIWNTLKAAQYLVEDSDRTNLSNSHGKESHKSFIGSNLFTQLKNIDQDYGFIASSLKKLITSLYSRSQKNLKIDLARMENIFNCWLGISKTKSTSKSIIEKIFELLEQYLTNPLDAEFQNILKGYEPYFPEIVRVLFTYFGRQLGNSEFDVETYAIDCNGNHRIFHTGFNHYQLQYEENSNRINGIKYKAFDSAKPEVVHPMQHDSRGNVVQALHKGIESMSYHPVSNLLQKVKMINGTIVEFFYDSKCERILKRQINSNGEIRKEIHYLRDEQGRSLVERELNFLDPEQRPAVLITIYIYGPDGLIGFIRNDQFYSVLRDHQGSVRLIVSNGEVVSAYDYLPYGDLMRIYGSDPEAHISYRYTGQEWDAEIGLYNYHARFYDPNIGRFYQIDPKEQYFSPYKYAGNSPVSMVDPDGEFAFLAVSLALMTAGAYLHGAAANNSWNPIRWNYKDVRTYLGIFVGATSGFFFTTGLMYSLQFLIAAGLSTAAAVTAISSTAITLSYLSAAAANGNWNPIKWNFSSPVTWHAMIEGGMLGANIFGNFRYVQHVYKQFATVGKIIFISSSAFIGIGLFIVNGKATKWNIKDPAFWFGSVSSVIAAPQLVIFGINSIKITQMRWTLFRDFISQSSDGNVTAGMVAKVLFCDAVIGISAFIIGSALNNGYSKCDWTEVSTYLNILTALQISAQAYEMGKKGVSAAKKKMQLKQSEKALALSEKVAKMATETYLEMIKETEIKTSSNDGGEKIDNVKKINPKNPEYNDRTKNLLKSDKIPNTVISVVITDKVIIIGFSSNSAPGVYLAYDHTNFSNPTFSAVHYEVNNKMLCGKPIAIRDDPALAAKIQKAVQDVQNGIKEQNKLTFKVENLRDTLQQLQNLDNTVDPIVKGKLVDAIQNEIMSNGYVEEKFVNQKAKEFNFENDTIRDANGKLKQAQLELDALNQQAKLIRDPIEQAKLNTERKRLQSNVNRARNDQNLITIRERQNYVNQLVEPVRTFKENLTLWDITNCGEAHVLSAIERQDQVFGDQLVKRHARDVQLDVKYMASFDTKDLNPMTRCKNCLQTTSQIRNVLTDNGFMNNLKNLATTAQIKAMNCGARLIFLSPMLNCAKIVEEAKQKQKREKEETEGKEKDKTE